MQLEHKTFKDCKLTLPEKYEKVPLKGLTKWLEALRSDDFTQGEYPTKDSVMVCTATLLFLASITQQ